MAEGTSITIKNPNVLKGDLNGPQKAAALMLALGEENGKEIWTRLEDDEIKTISTAMAQLGGIPPLAFEDVLVDFVSRMATDGAMTGTSANTEQLLKSFLPADRVAHIMEEIRGPSGRNMWEKLSNVQANVLASYLKNEYPQTCLLYTSPSPRDRG